MNGVTFGDIHSYNDLNLILTPFTPAPAEPKLNFLEIPGRDGHLDLTEANGEVKYNSREFEFVFTVAPGDPLTFDERVSVVSNKLNGLRCNITLDRDPDWYWNGRCVVSEYIQDKNVGQIVVKATVDPYKTKHEKTEVGLTSFDKTEWITVVLYNGGKTVVPTITCLGSNGSFMLKFGADQRAFTPGEHEWPLLQLVTGENLVLAKVQGSIYFTYQEEGL